MAQQNVSLPAGFGGITRFKEEYASLINLTPVHILAFVIAIIVFRIFLGVFWG